jgi:hypothetical protein
MAASIGLNENWATLKVRLGDGEHANPGMQLKP